MTDQMTRLRQEAEERWPIKGAPRDSLESARQSYRAGARQGFIAGRTISRDQLEQAAAAANAMLCQYARDGAVDIEVFNDGMDLEFSMIRAALEAAGLLIEDE